MENFEKCTVAMLGGPCSQHVTGHTSRQNQCYNKYPISVSLNLVSKGADDSICFSLTTYRQIDRRCWGLKTGPDRASGWPPRIFLLGSPVMEQCPVTTLPKIVKSPRWVIWYHGSSRYIRTLQSAITAITISLLAICVFTKWQMLITMSLKNGSIKFTEQCTECASANWCIKKLPTVPCWQVTQAPCLGLSSLGRLIHTQGGILSRVNTSD